MDYEKKYKEVLKKAKKELQACGSDNCDAARQIYRFFPELKESEDERIRKELISIVKSYRESCITEGNHRFDDCIAWLEKQGERKTAKEVKEQPYVLPTSPQPLEPLKPGETYPPVITWSCPCAIGGICTNPQHDCINCPKEQVVGTFTTGTPPSPETTVIS